MMEWPYFTFDPITGHLFDENDSELGKDVLRDANGRAIVFKSAQDAEQYLVDNDIRGNVR